MTATSSCYSTLLQLTNANGIIQTNEFITYYGNNLDCQWNISSNAMLELVFNRFNTETTVDYINVYSGGSLSSPLIGSFSGSTLPKPIESSSGKLYVRFISDGSTTYQGVSASYRGKMMAYIKDVIRFGTCIKCIFYER